MHKFYIIKCLMALCLSFTASVALAEYACEPTPQMSKGTHYKAVTAEKGDVGKGFFVRGTVFSATDCKAISNAKVTHWQAGKDGRYHDRFYSVIRVNAKGQFGFETEYPGIKPPHIHFIIEAPGYKTLSTQWVSQGFRDRITLYLTLEPKE